MEKQIISVHAMHRQRLRLKYIRDEATMCDHEMLELFLFDAIPRHNTNPMAHALLDRFGSLLGVLTADKSELMKIPGVGESVAAYIKETYKEYSERMIASVKTEDEVSVGQIYNYLIWHRMNESASRGHDGYITVVALDGRMRIADIYDVDGDDIVRVTESEKIRGTYAVMIGVGDAEVSINENCFEDSFVIDIIAVNGASAKSLREEMHGCAEK